MGEGNQQGLESGRPWRQVEGMTLEDFLAALHAKAAIARQAGDLARATEFEAAANELDAAYQAHQAAEGKKVELFLQADQIDGKLGRIVLEPHETAAELGAGLALAALERLEEALTRCKELRYPA